MIRPITVFGGVKVFGFVYCFVGRLQLFAADGFLLDSRLTI